MNRFCVITNSDKDVGCQTAHYIAAFMEKRGKTCILTKDYKEHFMGSTAYTDVSEIPDETECAIVLGGDGTFIQAAIDIVYKRIPLLGVNMGTLGFLTEIEKQNLVPALEKLIEDDCQIEGRMMLSGCFADQGGQIKPVSQKEENLALNDIVITKSGSCRIITTRLFVNGELIETYVGDGVIISTPTGSTGYNLSAGGPVMTPEVEAIIVTPICPHSLNKRSLVIADKDRLAVEIGQEKVYQPDQAEAIFDGRVVSGMVSGERISIQRSKHETKIVKLTGSSFFGILKNKLKAAE